MSEIKRYTPEPEFVAGEFERVEMQERSDGDWVRYEDVLPRIQLANWLMDLVRDMNYIGDIDGYEVYEELARIGIVDKVAYNPDKHGEYEADPGDEIYWWKDK